MSTHRTSNSVPRTLLFLFSLSFITSQDYLKNIDPDNKRASIMQIQTSADVTVSDGLTYSAQTLFIDHQRAIFKRIYKDRIATEGVDGMTTWQYNGKIQTEANEMIRSITLGHQFHGILLMMLNKDRGMVHQRMSASVKSSIYGSDLDSKIRAQFEIDRDRVLTKVAFKFDDVQRYKLVDEDNLPIGMVFQPSPDYTITFKFDNWKMTKGINLPWTIIIDDGSRVFTYDYTKIEFNKGQMNDYRPPMEHQTAEQQIHRLHRQIMDDHLFERANTSFQLKGDSVYVLSAGEMYRSSGDDNAKRFQTMMGNRDYHIYDDVMKPVIHVSDDGTLGWAMVRIYAKGVRLNPDRSVKAPLEFSYAWVELYKKVNGRWTMVGNVSNTGD